MTTQPLTEKRLWELSNRIYATLCILRYRGEWHKASNLAIRWLEWAAKQQG